MPTLEAAPAVPAAAPSEAPSRAYVAPHIWLDAQGRGWIDDTNVKVIEIALDLLGPGWGAEEIFEQYPGDFTKAQIHAALGYYYDHEEEFKRAIEEQRLRIEALRKEMGESDLEKRLRQIKLAAKP